MHGIKRIALLLLIFLNSATVANANQPAYPIVTFDKIPPELIKIADDYLISIVGKEIFSTHYRRRLGNEFTPFDPFQLSSCTIFTGHRKNCSIFYDYFGNLPPHEGLTLANKDKTLRVQVDIVVDNTDAHPSGFVTTIRDGKIIYPNPDITYEVALKTAYEFLKSQQSNDFQAPPFEDFLVNKPVNKFGRKIIWSRYSHKGGDKAMNDQGKDQDWLWGFLFSLPATHADCYVEYSIGVSAVTGKIIDQKRSPIVKDTGAICS